MMISTLNHARAIYIVSTFFLIKSKLLFLALLLLGDQFMRQFIHFN